MTLIRLDVRDTTILKGIAISSIAFHNYFHLLSAAQGNEFAFDPTRFLRLLATASHPTLSVQAFFSFFGHYGVQIFTFLSAYGLAKSHWDDSATWSTFLWRRVKKLYPAFGLVILPWIIVMCVQIGPLQAIRDVGLEMVLMFAGLSNIVPQHALLLIGPWWFIPFIFQFYAIWPLMRKLTLKYNWLGLLIFSMASLALCCAANPVLAHWSINLFATPLGHMPEFCLGTLAAIYPIRVTFPLALSGFAVVLTGNIYPAIWPFTFVAVIIPTLWVYLRVRGILRRVRVLERIGHYSIFIFLVNGIVRVPFIALATTPGSQVAFGMLSVGISVMIAASIQGLLVTQRGIPEYASV